VINVIGFSRDPSCLAIHSAVGAWIRIVTHLIASVTFGSF
jgi:hypothetical protein